jgi:hypothetical protein
MFQSRIAASAASTAIPIAIKLITNKPVHAPPSADGVTLG